MEKKQGQLNNGQTNVKINTYEERSVDKQTARITVNPPIKK